MNLYYEEKGTGEPLILLHGNGENGTYFVHQMEYFSKKYRVIAIDTRGHGKSPRGNAPFTIRQFADDLYEFMEQHQITKANILGFSDGGNIALIFAMKYPEMVDRLILNGANMDGDGVEEWIQIPIIIEYKIAKALAGRSPKAKKKAELYGLMVNDPNIKEKDLKKVQAHTLVIAGTRDMIKVEETRRIVMGIPKGQIAFIPGTHFIARDESEKFNAAIELFLEKTADCESYTKICENIYEK